MAWYKCRLTMSLLFLGYFLLLSFTEGRNKAFTCSPGPLTATCDAGKVILINRVLRGHYTGDFNASHCKFQVGDSTENDDWNSREVWKGCNLQRTCSVPFIQSGNYYLEMNYECVNTSNIDMLDICDTGSGTLLNSTHGYIHSPCYQNPSTWTESTHVYCQCSGSFQTPGKREDLTISLFHAFRETESLDIRWHAITNPPETFKSTSPNFIRRRTRSFHLAFSSTYLGSDWDRGFWLEFKANYPLEIKCSNRDNTLPTCQTPIIPPLTTISTTATTTTTTIKPTTTHVPDSKTTSSSAGGGLPGLKTTIPGTATSNSSPTHATTKGVSGSQLSRQGVIIPVTVGLAVPLIIVSAVLTSLIIILWRNGSIARFCKYHCGENTNDGTKNNSNADTSSRPVSENVGADYENVSKSNFVNHAFDGDKNPSLQTISDTANSSYVNVPDIAANSMDKHTQRMPTYENVGPNGRSQGGVFGTGSRRQEATASMDAYGDGSPYAEVRDTSASMPGAGAAAESPYAKLEPVERSEYLDLRHIGFADPSHSK